MADIAERRTRPASLSSSDETDDDDDASKTSVLVLASPSPSPSRPAGRRALEQPSSKRLVRSRRSRPVRMFDRMRRSLPLFNVSCGCQAEPAAPSDSLLGHLTSSPSPGLGSSRRRLTGTLFGYRDCRISLALQDNPRCVPALVLELAVPTHVLLRELSASAGARIVLETEAARRRDDDDFWVLREDMWTMFCGGKRVGYALRREPNDVDLEVLETLWAVSMGGGVLPGISDEDGPDGDMAYMRGGFDHAIGSQDSESLYMVGPPGGDCPELAIFFVRL